MLDSDRMVEEAAAFKARGEPFALVTVVRCESPTSAKPGAKAVVTYDGQIRGWIGGGCAQPAVIKTVKRAIDDGQARLIRISPAKGEHVEEGIEDFGMTCHSGGTLDIFIDPILPRPALLVIGGSPVAQSLVALASRVGYAVSVACPGASNELFADAQQLIDGLDLSGLSSCPSQVVVATQGKRDEDGLEAALCLGAPYVAFVASERKAQTLKTYLKERGHEASHVDAIVAPAGIEIGAVSPEEIALSVLAGVISVRRSGGLPAWQEEKSAESVTDEPASAIDPVCGMSVTIATAEHKSLYQDQCFYFCCAGCQHAFEKDPDPYLTAQVAS